MTDSYYTSPVLAAWRQAAGANWQAYTDHAFVRGLANGSLPQASFHYYLIQDYIFLIHFTRAWAMAVVKSESLNEIKIAAATVDALINKEMSLHVETCRQVGISEQQLYAAEEAMENLAYTRFVMDAGLSGDFLDLMAALAPCIFGYAEIGKTISKTAKPGTPYQEWIDTYAGDDYQDLCNRLGGMIESAVRARLGEHPSESPRWPLLCKRFHTATRLEVEFWEMGLRGQ